MIIPRLTPFHFTTSKEESGTYDDSFPNEKTSRLERRLTHPRWRQRVGSDITFCMWNSRIPTITTTLTSTIFITDSTIVDDDDNYLYVVHIVFTAYGKNEIQIEDSIDDIVMYSNVHIVSSRMYDENTIYGRLTFSNFENSYDYKFLSGETFIFYPIWLKEFEQIETALSSLDTSLTVVGSGVVTRGVPVEGLDIVIKNVEFWFAQKFIHICACSDITYNQISYTPEGVPEIDKSIKQSNMYNITISLRKRMDLI